MSKRLRGPLLVSVVLTGALTITVATADRARDLGIEPGVFPPGPLNAITDVAGVRVGHTTIVEGDDIRTGVTAILPHGGNLFGRRSLAQSSSATRSVSWRDRPRSRSWARSRRRSSSRTP